MAHQSLYRRYRPQRFSEVRGQDQVVNALRSAVSEGRVGHAYLFSGPRGTGKTSTARILAKALNCEDLQGGEPCGACAACTAMQAGTSYDLQELDAASNNKVEDVRSLVERVALGSPGRTKVYILDEVHMLSTGASNALLKTLEEPPDHVVFVLATTDPQKVLPTIRSRTQHFTFHLLPADVMADHVRWVITEAGLDVDDTAVEHVLRAGGGSARDALSALDQAAAGGVSDAGDHAEALAEAVMTGDVAAALAAVAAATAAGRDPRVLGEALLTHLRDVFLHRMGGPQEHLSDTARDRVAAWAGRVTDRSVTRGLEEVGEALLAMRQAPDPRIPLEVALVRVTREAPVAADAHPDLADLVARIERLERGAPSPAPAPAAPVDPPQPVPTSSSAAPADEAVPAAPPSPAPGSAPDGSLAGDELAEPDEPPEQLPPPEWLADDDPAGAAPGGPTGAAKARAALAGRAAAPVAAASSAGSPPPPPPPVSRPGAILTPASGSGAGPAPAPPVSAPDEGPAPAVAFPAAAAPGLDDVARVWSDVQLGLKGMAKALFRVGAVLDADGSSVTIGLPDTVHRDRCDPKRGEVEAALGAALGHPVRVVLAVGGDAGAGDPGGEGPVDEEPSPPIQVEAPAPPDPAPAGDDPPTPPTPTGPSPAEQQEAVERVTQAFSGARVVER